MKYGFVKIAAASPELKVADVKFNTLKIEEEIARQANAGTEILAFPELGLCGYTCGDLFLQPLLIDGCRAALKEITAFTKGISMLVFVGLPFAHGGKLYNCAAAVCDGWVLGIVPKTHIPNYSEFYEKRYFSPAPPENFPVCLWEGEENGEGLTFGAKQIFADENNPDVRVACEIAKICGRGRRLPPLMRRTGPPSSSICPPRTRPSEKRITAACSSVRNRGAASARTYMPTRARANPRRIWFSRGII